MNSALIFAGGSGIRMKTSSKPKQFLQLYGKDILIHTIENFEKHPEIDNIVLVCIEPWIEYCDALLKKFHIKKVCKIVAGGTTGQNSIYNGLTALKEYGKDSDIVLIHDGVRPFIDSEVISKCIEAAKINGTAISVIPAIETIVQLNDQKIVNITDRSKCFHAKAPQCFRLGDIFTAHQKAQNENKYDFIDSASLMQYYGFELFAVECNYDNIKITTPSDFYVFRALYELRENSQIFGL